MGGRPTEHEFIILGPDGKEHRFTIMLGLIDEDGFAFYDNNSRDHITTCSCGQKHPLGRFSTIVDFGKREDSENHFQVNLENIAEILHFHKLELRIRSYVGGPVTSLPSIKLIVKRYKDFEIIHELTDDTLCLYRSYKPVTCSCKERTRMYTGGCLGHQHWVDDQRLVYIDVSNNSATNQYEIVACIDHPIFTEKFYEEHFKVSI